MANLHSLKEAVAILRTAHNEQPEVQSVSPPRTVRKWFGNVYQKREDGRWNKLGREEKKKPKSRFK